MTKLQAGPITALYENGFLRRISYGETEVLRMIYFALRDQNWNTLTSQIENENLSIEEDHFEISYDCFHPYGGATAMEWKCSIAGQSDGTLRFEIRGVALKNFKKNRAGFCVLHPLNITGQDCVITHPDQKTTTNRFPLEVAPENPFKNIQSMSWETAKITFSLLFEGDIFETEDQRNWSDASFKTFCTPLDKPFPVELKKDEKVFQRITFKPRTTLQSVKGAPPHISFRKNHTLSVLPYMGIAASTEVTRVSETAVSLIRGLNLSHYRIDVYPGKENWVSDFSNSYEDSFSLGLPSEVVLHLSENFLEEIESFTIVCQQNRVKLRKVMPLPTNGLVTGQNLIDRLSGLKAIFPKVLFGAGTNYNFNEINKNHFSGREVDYISFSIDPQEHAFDDLTIMENIGAQEHLVRSAKAIYGKTMPVHISPLTLRKRFNPYATNAADLFIEESKKADPRQKEEFAAAWTFGSLCNLTKGEASAITFFQTIGNQGILSSEGAPYPVYHTLKGFSPYQGKSVSILESSDPLAAQGILLDGKLMGLVNLTQEEKAVRFDNSEYRLGAHEIWFEALHRA
ncbi:MAG: hypothetical protein WD824_22560 [Cyclobacteriaceae bacterium]